MTTLSSAIEQLNGQDFTHFGVVGEKLRAFDIEKTFGAHEVTIRGYQRFEGVSDPTTWRSYMRSRARTGREGV
jgi:nucleoid-associated protein YejK